MNDRAIRAVEDVVAVETLAPGMVRVVTFSDAYTVDARDGGCMCPDAQYNLAPGERCKHWHAAMLHTSDQFPEFRADESLDAAPRVVTDGGQVQTPEGLDQFTVADVRNERCFHFSDRASADDKMDAAEQVPGVDPELFPPGDAPAFLEGEIPDGSGEPEVDVVDHTDDATDDAPDSNHEPEVLSPEEVEQAADQLPERHVDQDPLKWLPGEFVDTIDGSPAINRKGFEVLSHFYNVSVSADLQVAPEETEHEYCRVKATAEIDGRTVEAYGSAHVDRGDDHYLLLEMAGTRARKRALSIATGAGAVAVDELRNEPEGGR